MQNAQNIESSSDAVINDNLTLAKQLVKHLEAENIEQADLVINEICIARENDMFQELGKLTRDLHESINDINGDSRLNDIMHNEMPDARHNLSHVIELTENSANQTLTAVESCTLIVDKLDERAGYLQRVLQGHIKNPDKLAEPHFVEEELNGFLEKVQQDIKHIKNDMNSILMAQGFQDISGQIIQRVNKMVEDVEKSLVSILKFNSPGTDDKKTDNAEKNRTGHGPAIPGMQADDVMNNQDEVDDLLSTLGF